MIWGETPLFLETPAWPLAANKQNCHQNVSMSSMSSLPKDSKLTLDLGCGFLNIYIYIGNQQNLGWRILRMEKSVVYKQWITNTLWICQWYLDLEQNLTLNLKSYKNSGTVSVQIVHWIASPKQILDGWIVAKTRTTTTLQIIFQESVRQSKTPRY